MAHNFAKHLLVVEVFKSDRYFIFTLLIENDFEGASVIADFKESAHWLLLFVYNSAYDDNLNKSKSWSVSIG